MKRNIYISGIHSESMNYKYKIIDRFKGRKYKASEELYTFDMTFEQDSEESIKIGKNIARTDVTVVLISRSVLESNWIPLEVKYSLEGFSNTKTELKPNGVIGVVIPDKGNDYSYIMKKGLKGIWRADKTKLPEIISSNINNEKVIQNKNNVSYDSFISVYRWEDFVRNFESCINIAYDKATNLYENYNISK